MSKNKNAIPHIHRPPISRRDFLAQGIISLAGTTIAPTLLSLLGQNAEAACPAMGWAPGMLPFFVFDLAGGAAMTGNFLVGKEGGPEDLLSSYDYLGWNPRQAGSLDTRFGLPMAANGISQMLVGLTENASANALSKVRMGSLCHFGQPDSINIDKSSAVVLVSEAGLAGNRLAVGLSTQSSPSGGNQGVPVVKPAYKPLQIVKFEDLNTALSFGPSMTFSGTYGRMPASAVESMARALFKVNSHQSLAIASQNNGATLGNLVNCASASNIALASPAPFNMDPRKDPVAAAVYGINETTSSEDTSVIEATIAFNCLKGYTGPGVISKGGYDYHTGEQTVGDARDKAAGKTIARVIELAHRLNQPFLFQIITDGGMAAVRGTRNWITDTASSLTVIGQYHPSGAKPGSLVQLGNYTDGQGVNGKSLVGSSTEKVAYVVFANYLAACGQLNKLRSFIPESKFPTPTAGWDSILFFG